MKLQYLNEPDLEFGSGKHIDIRFGLMNYGPLDCTSATAPKKIRVGIVGTSESIEGLVDWLNKCRDEIAPKKSRLPNLFPRFPGFNERHAFLSELVLDLALTYTIPTQEVERISRIAVGSVAVVHCVQAFVEGIEHLTDKNPPDVILCAVSDALMSAMVSVEDEPTENAEDEEQSEMSHGRNRIDFHDLLKARSMEVPSARPIQIVLQSTFSSGKSKRRIRRTGENHPIQDEATRAWNIHVALYYKAGGAPWRLVDETGKLTTCFVGVGFYNSVDRERILTSVAQVFNERGIGMVVRGGTAQIEKEDRQVHLSEEDSYQLLKRALSVYKKEHRTLPARVVLHKTSLHNDAEERGFRAAIDEFGIDSVDLLSLRKSFTRLFRNAEYPPLRGTLLSLDSTQQVLYTRGSIDFFATYPGMYMPRPLSISYRSISSTPRYLAQEILALTKMNWNNTQFDGGMPITIRAAQQVGQILRYISDNDSVQSRYAHYM